MASVEGISPLQDFLDSIDEATPVFVGLWDTKISEPPDEEFEFHKLTAAYRVLESP